jgi:DNA-binding NarL/FixJ family response regulator
MIRILIAEEHAVVRWALSHALGSTEDMAVVGEAGTPQEAVQLAGDVHPDVVVSGMVEALDELRAAATLPPSIVLTCHTEPSFAARALEAGAHGFLSTHVEPDELLQAIRAVHRGEQVLPEPITANGADPAGALTSREQQVMEMLARGMTNREIAEGLQISIKTVDTHRGHVLKKLKLRNNSELTRFAVKHGYTAL